MSKEALTTFEREMKNKAFKKSFESGYKTFLLSELMIELMEKSHKSVRQLASEVGISPTVIQNVRSGKQEDLKVTNFIGISEACGYHLVLEKGEHRIEL